MNQLKSKSFIEKKITNSNPNQNQKNKFCLKN